MLASCIHAHVYPYQSAVLVHGELSSMLDSKLKSIWAFAASYTGIDHNQSQQSDKPNRELKSMHALNRCDKCDAKSAQHEHKHETDESFT